MNSVKISVLGTGHLGAHHTRILSQLPGAELVGIYDPDKGRMEKIATDFGARAFDNIDELLELSDAVVIASPTATHRAVAERALAAGCHALVEKPLADTADEGEAIIRSAQSTGKKLMVGHIEQFNPAFEAARPLIDKPLFVESHRLTAFRGRGIDVPVIHDLLIHDLELLLALLDEDVVSINASAKAILTESPDIVNVRLKFFGGCVVNLTASRISLGNMRKTRFFQQGAYISVDFGEGIVEVATLGDGPKPPDDVESLSLPGGETIFRWRVPVTKKDALTAELEHFLDCIRTDVIPRVSGEKGLKALRMADKILEIAGES